MRKIFLIPLLFLSVSGVTQSLIDTYPYFANFENGASGWTVSDSLNFELGSPSDSVLNSAYSGNNAWASRLNAHYNSNVYGFIESPTFDFSFLEVVPWVRIKLNYLTESCCDYLRVEYSTDGGLTYQTLGLGDAERQNWYIDQSTHFWSGDSKGWVISSVRDSALFEEENVKFRLVFISDHENQNEGFLMDDFEITTEIKDVECLEVVSPSSSCYLGSNESVTAKFQNLGPNSVSGIQTFFSVNGGAPFQGGNINLNSGETKIHTFPGILNLSPNGDYEIRAWCKAPGDTTRVNDTARSLVVNFDEVNSFPYLEDFESGNGNWEAMGENNTWAFGEPQKRTIVPTANTGNNVWVTGGLSYGSYENGEVSMVQSPCMDITGTSDPVFQFDIWWNIEADYDGAQLQISRNNDSVWTSISGGLNWYNNSSVEALLDLDSLDGKGWSGRIKTGDGSGQWVRAQGSVPRLSTDTSVRFRVLFASDVLVTDDGFAFDNVLIYDRAVTDLAVESLIIPGGNYYCLGDTLMIQAIIRNNGSGSVGSFNLDYDIGGNTGSVPYSGMLAAGGMDTVQISDLILSNPAEEEILVYSSIVGDPYQFNDTSRSFYQAFASTLDHPGGLNTTICDSSRAFLSVSGDSNLAVTWYDKATRDSIVGTGKDWLTGILTENTTLYFDQFLATKGFVGPENHSFGTGGFTSVSGSIHFSVYRPVVWEHAWIESELNGNIDLILKSREGEKLGTRNVEYFQGWNRSSIGFRLDPGDYVLEITNLSGGLIFRNDNGAKYSSYEIPGVISLTGNGIDPGFFYYLYNWELSIPETCPGQGRYDITMGSNAPQASFTYSQDKNSVQFFNSSQSATSFDWDFGDGNFSNIPEPFHRYDSGTYQVTLSVESDCGTSSFSDSIFITMISSLAEKQELPEIKIFPNPGRDHVKLAIPEGSSELLLVEIYDIHGRIQLKSELQGAELMISTQNLSKGLYLVRISSDKDSQTFRWIKE